MGEGEPTNAVLAAKMDGLRELMEVKFSANDKHHKAVNEHLKKLNGQVARNTKFRTESLVLVAFGVFVVPLAITIIFKYI